MYSNLFEIFTSHALISVVPGMFGSILGAGIGHLSHRLLIRPDGNRTGVRRFDILFPWRAIVLLVLVILLPSPYAPILLGLGIPPALMTVFLSTTVLAIGLVLQGHVRAQYEKLGISTSYASARTALVAAVGFAVVTYEFGVGSAGFLIREGMQLFEYDVMWTGYAIVGILAAILDIAAGAGQLALSSWSEITGAGS